MGRKLSNTTDLGLSAMYDVPMPYESGLSGGKLHWIGDREEQQDAFGISDISGYMEKGIFLILADGMGGMEGGRIVSSMAVMSCLEDFESISGKMGEDIIEDMVYHANERVIDHMQRECFSGGSTIVLAQVFKDSVIWASAGDSRLYHYRNKILTRVTRDHNLGMTLDMMAREGRITEEEARTDKGRAALISYLGKKNNLIVDTGKIALEKGDKILLSTDGVFGTLTDEEMEDGLSFPAKKAMMRYEMLISTKRKPGQDNYTALCMEVL